ncbi:MAG: hypothetical protein ABID45_03705 [Patescibacteria group bacterium]
MNQLNEKGLEKYPALGIFLENFALILWIIFGFISCWFLYPVVAWIYLAFAVIMIVFVLRKLLCTNCYYYDKWCHVGWGKLAALFFKKGNIEKFNSGLGQKIVPFTYGLLALVPLIFIIITLIQDFSVFKIVVLVLFLISAFLSSVTLRKNSCSKCKMRYCCKGCAVK